MLPTVTRADGLPGRWIVDSTDDIHSRHAHIRASISQRSDERGQHLRILRREGFKPEERSSPHRRVTILPQHVQEERCCACALKSGHGSQTCGSQRGVPMGHVRLNHGKGGRIPQGLEAKEAELALVGIIRLNTLDRVDGLRTERSGGDVFRAARPGPAGEESGDEEQGEGPVSAGVARAAA